jgi:hypothetical protein
LAGDLNSNLVIGPAGRVYVLIQEILTTRGG